MTNTKLELLMEWEPNKYWHVQADQYSTHNIPVREISTLDTRMLESKETLPMSEVAERHRPFGAQAYCLRDIELSDDLFFIGPFPVFPAGEATIVYLRYM